MPGDGTAKSTKSSAEPTSSPPKKRGSNDPDSTTSLGFWASLGTILRYRGFSVYLVTSWILGIFGVIISYYIYYYLRDILLDYVLVGVLLTIYMSMELVMRFLGG